VVPVLIDQLARSENPDQALIALDLEGVAGLAFAASFFEKLEPEPRSLRGAIERIRGAITST
jgi:hypothetical protein